MVRADNSALQQSPERFDIVRVNLAAHVLAAGMTDDFVPIEVSQIAVSARFIGRDQTNLFGDGLLNEAAQAVRRSGFDYLANEIALARDRADDGRFAGVSRTATAVLLPIDPVPVLLFTADLGFVNLNDAHQLLEVRIVHRGAESHAHVPSRPIGTESDHTVNLKRAHALLAGEHEVKNLKPRAERHLGLLEDGSRLEREAVRRAVIFAAFLALPVPRSGGAFIDAIVIAAGAVRSARPAAQEQVGPARLLIWKEPIEVSKRHLANEARFGIFVIAHVRDISVDLDGRRQAHNPQKLQTKRKAQGRAARSYQNRKA